MRQPRLARLKTAYLSLPPRVRGAIPARLELWLQRRYISATGAGGPAGSVSYFEDRLWRGFSGPARAGLEALVADPKTPRRSAVNAAWSLAQWYAVSGDLDGALEMAAIVRERDPTRGRRPQHILREAGLLCQAGRALEARRLVAQLDRHTKADVSTALMRANLHNPIAGAPEPKAPDQLLAEINTMFGRGGLAPLDWREPATLPSLDNLCTADPVPPTHRGPCVSVIVPLHNGGDTVETALRGLIAQTHRDLEILVVDDASTDDGPERVATMAGADPRIRLIHQEVNHGAYAARNRGLADATGEFVTVHDADDWSHPEKIARHLADLEHREAPFNISTWVRTTPDLLFIGGWRPAARLTERNFSSVFFRRSLVELYGPWDNARLSADREFVNRIERLHGLPPQMPILGETPLAFGQITPGSLTRTGPTHVSTIYHGLRREYFEATDLWHARLDPAIVQKDGLTVRPPYFPAPWTLHPDRPRGEHDLLVIGDFNLRGGTQKSALNMISAARASGLDTAILQYRRIDRNVTWPLDPKVRAMAWDQDVRIVAPGENLGAKTVIVSYPPILDTLLDRFPQIDHAQLVMVVNQMAERAHNGADIAYDPNRVRKHLRNLFGSEGVWVPISERVRTLMADDPRYPAPSGDTWTPLIDTDLWTANEPRWRGGDGRRPVIGRHGRDHPLKWIAEVDALRAAYCADRSCETRFLGGAVHARARLRRWPRNWRDMAFDAVGVKEFLADLDVFLHFPARDYIEEFGRAPMEAMAVGVPVVLPPEFEPTFGSAALYTEPEGVWDLVQRLWTERDFWEAHIAAGRTFVMRNCSYEAFPERLARLSDAAAPVQRTAS